MIYIDDAIRAIVELMEAPPQKISIRSSYNVSGISCSPKEIYEEIKKHIPEFKINYSPDFRQNIAATFPESVDDSTAQNDWNWTPQYDLAKIVEEMIGHLKKNNERDDDE